MKNLLLSLFLLFPFELFGQGIYIPARTVEATVNGITRPVAGATITVCAANTAGIPCAPALANTVFKDSGLTIPLSNPFTSDSNGNYPQAALAGGVYTITESATGFAGFSYQATVSCAAGAPCTITGPFNVNGATTITGALTAGSESVTGNLVIGGGGPWFDVTSTAFGANTCTGSSHDDTPAFLAAITAANTAKGGVVFVPVTSSGCFWNTALVTPTSTTNVRITGGGGPGWFSSTLSPLITCTVSGSGNCLTALGTVALEMDHVNVVYNSATFTGTVLNFASTVAQTCQGTYLHDMAVQGTSTATGATQLVGLTQGAASFGCDDVTISNVNFHNAVNAINGQAAQVVRVLDSAFSTATGTISGAFIKNPPSSSLFLNDVFEMGNALGQVSIVDCTTTCASNLAFISCWAGDTPANYSGTLFKAIGGSSANLTLRDNQFSGGSSLLGVMWNNTGGFSGLHVSGNQFTNWGTLFKVDAALLDVSIDASNFYGGTITNFIAGSVGFFNPPAEYVDNTGKVLKTIPQINFSERPGPCVAPGSGNDALCPDSTAHAFLASYNNSAFSKIPLVGIANTWTAAQTLGSGGSLNATNLLISPTAPTIAAGGCGGAAASIATNNGTASFSINVGTTPTSGGCTVTMPSATNGWNCSATDITTNSTSVFVQKQTATSATSVTLVNFNDVAVATAPTASDIWQVSCFAR